MPGGYRATCLGSVKSSHLQAVERSRTGQCDIGLTLLEHPAQVDLDTIQSCNVGMVSSSSQPSPNLYLLCP